MAYIRKREDGYRAEVYKKGVRESKTFPTRQEAVDWSAQREDEILRGMGGTSNRSFAVVVDKFIKSNPPSDRFDRTRKNALYRLPFADRPVASITPADISSWRDLRLSSPRSAKDSRPVEPGTVARELTVIQSALEYARGDLGWIRVNPASDVKAPAEPPARRRVITADEQTEVLKALDWTGVVETPSHEVAAAFVLALETGMRAGEIVGLTWSRVFDKHVHLPKTKNGEARDVPLNAKAREVLRALKAKKLRNIRSAVNKSKVFHVASDSRDQTFRRAMEKAGLTGFRFHDSRTTAITRYAKVLTVLELARMIGHKDINSLLWYYAETASAIAEKLDGTPANQSPPPPASEEPAQAEKV